MKTTYLILAGLLGTALASQGDIITYTLGTDTVDGGAFNSATHTWTESVTGVNGLSFDLVLTAVASGAAWVGLADEMGVDDNNVDSGESGAFSVAIQNFNAGTSGFVEADVDFGFVGDRMSRAGGVTDPGTYTLLNGAAPTDPGAPHSFPLTWTDINGGPDFTGHGGTTTGVDLQLMNDTYGTGDRLTSFTHESVGAGFWRFNQINVEYNVPAIPEPATIGMLGLGGLISLFIRRRKRA